MKAKTLESTRAKQRKVEDALLRMRPAEALGLPAALTGLQPASSPASLHFNVEGAGEPLPLPTRAPGYNGKAERGRGAVSWHNSLPSRCSRPSARWGRGKSYPQRGVLSHQHSASAQALSHRMGLKGDRGRSLKAAPSPRPAQSPVL